MKKKSKIVFPAFIVSLLLFTAIDSFSKSSIDPSMYSVPLSGSSKKIIAEKITGYKISSSDENFSLPNTPFQKVIHENAAKGRKVLSLISGSIEYKNIIPAKDDIQNTRFLNLESPEIREISKKFKTFKSPIDSIEKYVYEYINHKTYGIPIISALDILKSRTGDCTEHSILTIAILRSIGIPAKAMVGMIFAENFEGLKDVFVFHMWVMAYHEGRWILVDATRPGEKNINRYIAFSSHHLKTEMPLEYLKAITAIKELAVSVE